MYDITKARMLLTTAAFAAVAAVCAGGANARIPEEDGSGIGAEPVAVVATTVDPLASSRLTGLLRAARTRDLESGALSGEQQAPQESGTFFVEEICAALDLEQTRGVLINEQAIKAASPGAIQECLHAAARAAKPIVPVLRYDSPTGTGRQRVARAWLNKFPDGYRGDQLDPAIRTAITTRVGETTAMPWTIPDLSDSALAKSNGRYTKSARAIRTAQAKFCANTKLVHDMNEEALDQGWSQDAMVALFQSEIIANRNGCAWGQ